MMRGYAQLLAEQAEGTHALMQVRMYACWKTSVSAVMLAGQTEVVMLNAGGTQSVGPIEHASEVGLARVVPRSACTAAVLVARPWAKLSRRAS